MRLLLLCVTMMCALSAMSQNVVNHTVKSGETLESIARKYGVTVADIQAGNPDVKSNFFTGMQLSILTRKNVASTEEYREKPSASASTGNPDGMVSAANYTFMFDSDADTYGLRMDINGGPMGILSLDAGIYNQFTKHGMMKAFMGIGVAPQYATGPITAGFHLYPYVSLYNRDEFQGTNENDKEVWKTKEKVGYGAALDLMAGFKIYTTSKGTDVYLTGSYFVMAEEFKTKGAFKNGIWGIGITLVE